MTEVEWYHWFGKKTTPEHTSCWCVCQVASAVWSNPALSFDQYGSNIYHSWEGLEPIANFSAWLVTVLCQNSEAHVLICHHSCSHFKWWMHILNRIGSYRWAQCCKQHIWNVIKVIYKACVPCRLSSSQHPRTLNNVLKVDGGCLILLMYIFKDFFFSGFIKKGSTTDISW